MMLIKDSFQSHFLSLKFISKAKKKHDFFCNIYILYIWLLIKSRKKKYKQKGKFQLKYYLIIIILFKRDTH